MREVPPIAWRAVLAGGAVALAAILLLSIASQPLPPVAVGIAAGALAAGRLATARSAFHGSLVAVLWIAAEALADPFVGRPLPVDVAADLARTILLDVLWLALGVGCGWLGGRLRR
jgi:hypothetical protein